MDSANPTTTSGASSIVDRIAASIAPVEVETAVKPVEVEEEVQQEEVDEVEAEAQEVEEDDVGEDAGEDTSEAQLSTEDFAQLLNLDSDKIDLDEKGNVVIRTKVDGVEKVATFKEILTDYQKIQHADNQLREIAEQKKSFQESLAKANEERQQKLAQLDSMIEYHKNQVLGKYQQYTPQKMEELRQYDPAEYSAVITDYQRDMASINQAIAHANAQKGVVTEEQKAEYQQMLANEAQKLVANIPTWTDETIAAQEKKEIFDWGSREFQKWGEDASALNNVNKGVLVDMMRKAMLYDKLQSNNPTVQNKVRKAPKIVKSGAKPNQVTSEQKKIKVLKNKIKTGGRVGNVAEYLLASGKV